MLSNIFFFKLYTNKLYTNTQYISLNSYSYHFSLSKKFFSIFTDLNQSSNFHFRVKNEINQLSFCLLVILPYSMINANFLKTYSFLNIKTYQIHILYIPDPLFNQIHFYKTLLTIYIKQINPLFIFIDGVYFKSLFFYLFKIKKLQFDYYRFYSSVLIPFFTNKFLLPTHTNILINYSNLL